MAISSASAKFILGGEHSVVTRGRALAFPLFSARLQIEIPTDAESVPQRKLIVNGQERSSEEHSLVQNLCLRVGAAFPPIFIKIDSSIPIGAGLGSSAALCVSLAKHFHPDATALECAKLALKGEELFHRNPSGIDPFTIALGTPIVFSGRSLDFRALNCDAFHKANLSFALFNTGYAHKTNEVQAAVERTHQSTPLIYDDLMDALSSNVERMLKAFEQGKPKELGQLTKDSHFRLVQLGVSDDHINQLADRVQALPGCYGAKITGAGCGGFLLGLFDRSALPLAVASEAPNDASSLKASFCWPSL